MCTHYMCDHTSWIVDPHMCAHYFWDHTHNGQLNLISQCLVDLGMEIFGNIVVSITLGIITFLMENNNISVSEDNLYES